MLRRENIVWIAAAPSLLLLAVAVLAIAGPVTLPHTFTAGTVADANQVNGNFQAVRAAVDDNDARITALEDPERRGTILAFAHINSDATVDNAWMSTGAAITNAQIDYPGTGEYRITLPGITYDFDSYPTVVTPVDFSSYYATIAMTAGNEIVVRIWDSTGTLANQNFQLVVWND